jgi:hypothetical protein
MRFLRFLVAAFSCSAPCVAEESVKLDSVFNIDDVNFVKLPGNSTVTGTASIKLADGTIKNCAGFNMELLPIAAYSKERIVRTYGNDQQGQILLEQNPPKFIPDVPEYHDTLIKGACDEHGEFRFSNVPAGDYFVMAFIIWEDTSGATPRKIGGAAMKRVHVAANSQVEAHLGDRAGLSVTPHEDRT